MKFNTFVIATLVLSPLFLFAQLQPAGSLPFTPLQFDLNRVGNTNSGSSRATTCDEDTVRLHQAKASGLQAIAINNVSSADAVGQYFEASQQITVRGFKFYAWVQPGQASVAEQLVCSITGVGSDSLPSVPFGSVQVTVDTSFGGGTLAELEYYAIFPTPVTIAGPYMLSVATSTGISTNMVGSDYNAGDGDSSWLANASIGGNWIRSYQVNIGAAVYNADFFMEPLITYDLEASYATSATCLTQPNQLVVFFNNSSPIMESPVYNIARFLNINDGYVWDFGDGQIDTTIAGPTHTYATPGTYATQLRTDIFGWNMVCADSSNVYLVDEASAFASPIVTGLAVDFNATIAGAGSFSWDFGDGSPLNTLDESPNHTYSSPGSYQVIVDMVGPCGNAADTFQVQVCNIGAAGFSASAAGLTANVIDGSTSAASISYDFGDGTVIAGTDTSHIYTDDGPFTITQTVVDSCGDTTTATQQVTVCGQVSAGFTFVVDENEVTFTNTSTHDSTHIWDFGDFSNSTQPSPVYTFSLPGTYYVCLTVTYSCNGLTDTFCDSVTIEEDTIIDGINDNQPMAMELYPNPADNYVTIRVSSGQNLVQYQLADVTGRLVNTGQFATETYTLSTAELAAGVYILRLTDGGNTVGTRKLMVE